ncbi:DegV family protein [Nonomuraea antimicrobica]
MGVGSPPIAEGTHGGIGAGTSPQTPPSASSANLDDPVPTAPSVPSANGDSPTPPSLRSSSKGDDHSAPTPLSASGDDSPPPPPPQNALSTPDDRPSLGGSLANVRRPSLAEDTSSEADPAHPASAHPASAHPATSHPPVTCHPPVTSSSLSSDEDSFTGDLSFAVTSRPSPARFASCYSSLAAAGATGIVSIHLSGELSGTVESARAAARDAPVPVEVLDSRSIAMGLGYPVLAAVRAAASGPPLAAVVSAARRCMASTRTYFYVDSLDYLRRSGRLGTVASLFGSALMIKPLLHIVDGRISLLEKVRTASRAIARLEDLAVQAAGDRPVEVAVQHLEAKDRAESLAQRLTTRVPGLVDLRIVEVGAVIGVHVGPGMLGVTVTSANP